MPVLAQEKKGLELLMVRNLSLALLIFKKSLYSYSKKWEDIVKTEEQLLRRLESYIRTSRFIVYQI